MASNIPKNLFYTTEHEWVLKEGDVYKVGITDFAQAALGDIVYVELPNIGKKVSKDEAFGVVESIKSVSDLYAPITGEVTEKNVATENNPELLNANSYEHWLIKIKASEQSEIDHLLTAEQYAKQVEGK
jgi:glycine cleavage system H protein